MRSVLSAPFEVISVSEEKVLTRAPSDLSVVDFTTTITGPHCARLLAG
jgi:hypothetical protein